MRLGCVNDITILTEIILSGLLVRTNSGWHLCLNCVQHDSKGAGGKRTTSGGIRSRCYKGRGMIYYYLNFWMLALLYTNLFITNYDWINTQNMSCLSNVNEKTKKKLIFVLPLLFLINTWLKQHKICLLKAGFGVWKGNQFPNPHQSYGIIYYDPH